MANWRAHAAACSPVRDAGHRLCLTAGCASVDAQPSLVCCDDCSGRGLTGLLRTEQIGCSISASSRCRPTSYRDPRLLNRTASSSRPRMSSASHYSSVPVSGSARPPRGARPGDGAAAQNGRVRCDGADWHSLRSLGFWSAVTPTSPSPDLYRRRQVVVPQEDQPSPAPAARSTSMPFMHRQKRNSKRCPQG